MNSKEVIDIQQGITEILEKMKAHKISQAAAARAANIDPRTFRKYFIDRDKTIEVGMFDAVVNGLTEIVTKKSKNNSHMAAAIKKLRQL